MSDNSRIQLTVEQLLREANDYKEVPIELPQEIIESKEELHLYRTNKRQWYEENIIKNRRNMALYVKYAKFEVMQHNFERMRSIYERALDIDYQNIQIWRKYIETELKYKYINHARNLLERVITYLPKIDEFWYKYTKLEQQLENPLGCRNIFQRWIQFKPNKLVWYAYIKFEIRYIKILNSNHDYIRSIYESLIKCHKDIDNYIKYANFEYKIVKNILNAREIYLRINEEMIIKNKDIATYYISFATFEQSVKEYERARQLYKYALTLDHINKNKIYQAYVHFERKYGNNQYIEDIILAKRQFEYESIVDKDPYNYDAWLNYINLQEYKKMDHNKLDLLYQRICSYIPQEQIKLNGQDIFISISNGLYG